MSPRPLTIVDRNAQRVRRRVDKARRQGLASVVRNDAVDARSKVRKRLWRLTQDCRPNAVAVYVVGIQRSGTTMLMKALDHSPAVAVYHEFNTEAFDDFVLRDDAVIRGLIVNSRHPVVAFKPLYDAHRVVHLMDELDTPTRGRAIWIYRNVEGRVRSTLAKWPEDDTTRDILRGIADGESSSWAAGGLSQATRALLGDFDYDAMSPESAAALLWYVRNSLFFDLGLDSRPDVALVSYERFLSDPTAQMRAICGFLSIPYEPSMVHGIAPRPAATTGPLAVDREVARLCGDLKRRLDREIEERPPTVTRG